MKFTTILSAAVLALFSMHSHAATITFDFTATVNFVDNIVGTPQLLPFQAGDQISGFYSFETATGTPISTGRVDYEDVIVDLQVTIGTYTATYTPGFNNHIEVFDQPGPNEGDRYVVGSNLEGPDIGGLSPYTFSLGLLDNTGTAWSSTDLPLVAPDLADFPTWQNLSVQFRTGSDYEDVYATLTSLTTREVSPVPIPTAAWLFASALGVFGYLGKRKATA